MLGKLTWNAIPWDQPIPLIAASVVFAVPHWRDCLDHSEGAIFPIFGASGSRAWTISASA